VSILLDVRTFNSLAGERAPGPIHACFSHQCYSHSCLLPFIIVIVRLKRRERGGESVWIPYYSFINVVIIGIEVRFVLYETNKEPPLGVALVGEAVGPEHQYV